MRAKRVDGNLEEIVKAARKLGYLIHVCNDNLCDVIAQKRGKTELWEIKDKRGTFTPLQKRMREQGWQIRTIRTIEDCAR